MHGMLTTHKLTYIRLTLQVFTQHTQDISAYLTFFSVLITYMSQYTLYVCVLYNVMHCRVRHQVEYLGLKENIRVTQRIPEIPQTVNRIKLTCSHVYIRIGSHMYIYK